MLKIQPMQLNGTDKYQNLTSATSADAVALAQYRKIEDVIA
jgi:hypothetical protein